MGFLGTAASTLVNIAFDLRASPKNLPGLDPRFPRDVPMSNLSCCPARSTHPDSRPSLSTVGRFSIDKYGTKSLGYKSSFPRAVSTLVHSSRLNTFRITTAGMSPRLSCAMGVSEHAIQRPILTSLAGMSIDPHGSAQAGSCGGDAYSDEPMMWRVRVERRCSFEPSILEVK